MGVDRGGVAGTDDGFDDPDRLLLEKDAVMVRGGHDPVELGRPGRVRSHA